MFEGLDVLIPNDTSIDNFLPSPDSHDGEQEGNLLQANVKGSDKSNATEDFYKHNKEFEVRDLLKGKETLDKGCVKVKNQSVPPLYTVSTSPLHSQYLPSTQSTTQ